MRSLRRRVEASGAVVRNDWHRSELRVLARHVLADVGEGSDYANIAGLDTVVRLHRAQAPVVECGHHERLRELRATRTR